MLPKLCEPAWYELLLVLPFELPRWAGIGPPWLAEALGLVLGLCTYGGVVALIAVALLARSITWRP